MDELSLDLNYPLDQKLVVAVREIIDRIWFIQNYIEQYFKAIAH